MKTGYIKCWYRCTNYPACSFAYDQERGLHPPRPPTNTGTPPSDRSPRSEKKEKKDEKDDKDHDDDSNKKP